MKMKERISPRDWILLSSYLDDELDPRQKARVEARLQARPELREGLAELQRTKEILRCAPARPAPRNFTLPPSMAKTRPGLSLRLVPALRLSSAVAALAAVFFVVSTLMGGFPPGMRMAAAPADQAAKEATTLQLESAPAIATEDAQVEEESPPPVVYWGGPPQPLQKYGMGGGAADTPPYGMGGGDSTELIPNGMGGGDAGYVPQPMVMATQPAEALQLQPTTPPASFPSPTPVPERELPAQPPSASGPILGVAPSEKQGDILPETSRQVLPMVAAGEPIEEERGAATALYGYIGAGLLVLAAGLFLAAWILRRNALR